MKNFYDSLCVNCSYSKTDVEKLMIKVVNNIGRALFIEYQTLLWNHRGWHCGSGSKGSGNNTHIGVEMCEPACIKYTSGSNFTCSDTATAKAVAKRTYETAVAA